LAIKASCTVKYRCRKTETKKVSLHRRETLAISGGDGGGVELPVQKSALQWEMVGFVLPKRDSTTLQVLMANGLSEAKNIRDPSLKLRVTFGAPLCSLSLGGEKEELGDTPILPRKDRQDPPKADCTSFEAPLAPPVLGD